MMTFHEWLIKHVRVGGPKHLVSVRAKAVLWAFVIESPEQAPETFNELAVLLHSQQFDRGVARLLWMQYTSFKKEQQTSCS